MMSSQNFACVVTQLMTKVVELSTDEYEVVDGGFDEDGLFFCDLDASGNDWEKIYRQSRYSILELLEVLKDYVEKDLEKITESDPNYKRLKLILEDCQDWECLESYVEDP